MVQLPPFVHRLLPTVLAYTDKLPLSRYDIYQFLYRLQLSTAKLILLLFLGVLVWFIDMLYIQPMSDPLRHLPGPKAPLLESHLQMLLDPMVTPQVHKKWRKLFGKTFRFHGFGRHDLRLLSFDYTVISRVLHSENFERPWQTRYFLGRLIGQGVFTVTGQEHTRQRRILQSALTLRSLKFMTPIFFTKAEELRERWKNALIEQAQAQDSKTTEAVFDIANWMSRVSFDIMGLTTLRHDFHSLQNESEPFYLAYRRMFNIADKGLTLRGILDLYFPILTKVWVNDDIRVTNESLRIISKTGLKIVAERKAAIQEAGIDEEADSDLLSLLVKSNTNFENPLTDQQILDHCSTFLLGGSDTVAVALSWCLYFLAINRDVQNRLRKELESISDGDLSESSSDSESGCPICETRPQAITYNRVCSYCARQPRWSAINQLQYLTNVVNESLRFCPPVHSTIRVARSDDDIPVSYPVTLSDGSTVSWEKSTSLGRDNRGSFKIRKGSYIHVPIEGWSLNEDVWGQDALVFDPDRWDKKPGMLSVFGGGSHMCPGSKFSVAEMKILLATLIPHFEFLLVENIAIGKFNTILTRPFVMGKWEEGTQLPILVRLLR